jgi:DNA (cytosine-5)-methyltransferase 1
MRDHQAASNQRRAQIRNGSVPTRVNHTDCSDVRAVSLFSGIGGLDAGFAEQGVKIDGAWDTNMAARETYELNLGVRPRADDLRKIDPASIPRCDIVLAGPPCQGFSSLAGHNGNDERNQLVLVAARLIGILRPKAFVIENVRGLCWQERGFFIRRILKLLHDAGLAAEAIEMDCAKLGLPQRRRRVLIVGGLGECGRGAIFGVRALSTKIHASVSVGGH